MTSIITPALRLPVRDRSARHKLMMGCASVAMLSSVVAAHDAYAQAFAGTPSVTSGTVTIDSTTPNVDNITVGSPTAVINWSPTDTGTGGGTIDFLPSTGTANFYGSSGDYTVLNRIVPNDPSRTIALNGSIYSWLDGGTTKGGNIWFYSPGGLLVGTGAIIDVGSLLLSTVDVTSFTASGTGFNATFALTESSAGAIEILPGAQINAENVTSNSYVAMVAPRIEQAGDVRVDGSVAYVAGEGVTMTMDQGLFDIQVGVGSGDANGIVHSGTTIGAANESLSNSNRMYFMAVPKNQAITMLVGGTIGYEATSASVVNGEIKLTAGVTQIDDIPDPYTSITIANSDSNILIDDATLLSSTRVTAMNLASVNASTGDVTFDGDLNMQSFYGGTSLIANGNAVTINGANTTLYTSSADFPPQSGESENRTAGFITVQAINGGTIGTKNLTLNAEGKGQDNNGNGSTTAGNGSGGNINVTASGGGSITVDGNMNCECRRAWR